MTPEKLLQLRNAYSQIESRFDMTDGEKNSAFLDFLNSEVSSSVARGKLLKTLSNSHAFEREYERLINQELYQKACVNGNTTFKSLTQCSNTTRTGVTCGNTVRYVSNRGCTLCQTTNAESKKAKEFAAHSIIKSFSSLHPRKPIVDSLIAELGVKKSAAYRLINIFEKGEALYNTTTSCLSNDPESSRLVKSLANIHNFDDYDFNQDIHSDVA